MTDFDRALARSLASEPWALACPHSQLQLTYNAARRWYLAECQACGRQIGSELDKRASTNPLAVHMWLAEIKGLLGMDDEQVILGQAELEGAR